MCTYWAISSTPRNEALRTETDRIRGDRIGRAERIVRNIGRDYDLDWEDVVAQTNLDATVGRPHIADALIARGIVRDRTEAFDGILHSARGVLTSRTMRRIPSPPYV